MELRLHHIVHPYNIFCENDGKENCAQLIEEEFYKMFEKKFPFHHFHEIHYEDEQYDATSIPFFSFLCINQTSDKTRN